MDQKTGRTTCSQRIKYLGPAILKHYEDIRIATPPSQRIAMKSRRPTILVVDDQPGARQLLALHLQSGYDVMTAADASTAIQRLRSTKIDLVIQDMGLPDMDGLTLLRTSKTLLPYLPIILISGGGTVSSAEHAIDFGAVAFLLKPFNLDELQTLIQDVFSGLGVC